jgi:hypothetical protein
MEESSRRMWSEMRWQGKDGSSALELLVENTEYYKTFKLDYHGGEKYPHLVRDDAKPDLLSDMIKPR